MKSPIPFEAYALRKARASGMRSSKRPGQDRNSISVMMEICASLPAYAAATASTPFTKSTSTLVSTRMRSPLIAHLPLDLQRWSGQFRECPEPLHRIEQLLWRCFVLAPLCPWCRRNLLDRSRLPFGCRSHTRGTCIHRLVLLGHGDTKIIQHTSIIPSRSPSPQAALPVACGISASSLPLPFSSSSRSKSF